MCTFIKNHCFCCGRIKEIYCLRECKGTFGEYRNKFWKPSECKRKELVSLEGFFKCKFCHKAHPPFEYECRKDRERIDKVSLRNENKKENDTSNIKKYGIFKSLKKFIFPQFNIRHRYKKIKND